MYNILFLLLFLSTNVFAKEIDVLVPVRNIKRGEIVKQDDLVIESVDIKSTKEYLLSFDLDSENFKAKKNLTAGKPIKKGDLIADNTTIHKGDIVTAKFIKKNLTIEVQAIALMDGKLNDTVRLKTTNTNKIVFAKVMEDGSIVILSD